MAASRLLLSLLSAIGLLLAGCLEENLPSPVSDFEPGSPWVRDCVTVSAPVHDCLRFFNGEHRGENQTEVSLATYLADSDKVLVSWRDLGPGNVRAAVTHDGGKTWVVSTLRNPAVMSAPEVSQISFDPTSVFLQDGTPAVLYAGENPYYGTTVAGEELGYIGSDRFTFAWSPDAGSTWRYQVVSGIPGGLFHADFMHMAVAPDTGRLSVVAMMFFYPAVALVPEGTWLWTSDDNGRSWSVPQRLELPTDVHFSPRIAAGPDGVLVVVTYGGLRTWMSALDPVSSKGVFVTLSRDAGATWTTQRVTMDDRLGFPGYGPAILHNDAETIEVVLAYQRNVSLVRSIDGGDTWAEPQKVGDLPADYDWWAIGAGDGKGQTVVLAQYDSDCEAAAEARQWGVDLFHEESDQTFRRLPMAGPLAKGVVDGCNGGNDYGGLAFAADGSLWAAWADPRGGDDASGIAVTRLVREE